jgi:hypothetical protein
MPMSAIPVQLPSEINDPPAADARAVRFASAGEPRRLRLTLVLVLIAFVALIAYWAIWFFVNRDWLANLDTPSYYTFENAFPAADAWLALACGFGAWALWRRRASALFWLLVGGSSSVYLGLMDVLFDLENGIYGAPKGDWGTVGAEVVINLYALGVGAWALRFGWAHRHYFLGRDVGRPSADGIA